MADEPRKKSELIKTGENSGEIVEYDDEGREVRRTYFGHRPDSATSEIQPEPLNEESQNGDEI
jgi:hypothetical protein